MKAEGDARAKMVIPFQDSGLEVGAPQRASLTDKLPTSGGRGVLRKKNISLLLVSEPAISQKRITGVLKTQYTMTAITLRRRTPKRPTRYKTQQNKSYAIVKCEWELRTGGQKASMHI